MNFPRPTLESGLTPEIEFMKHCIEGTIRCNDHQDEWAVDIQQWLVATSELVSHFLVEHWVPLQDAFLQLALLEWGYRAPDICECDCGRTRIVLPGLGPSSPSSSYYTPPVAAVNGISSTS